MNEPLLVDPAVLYHRELREDDLIVEVSGYESYGRGHIPGARCLPWQILVDMHGPLPGLPPSPRILTALLQRIGYSEQTHYWIYDDEGGGWAGRLIWILHLLGHQHVHYIDGGKHGWLADNLPLEYASRDYNEHQNDVPRIANKQLITLDQIIQDLQNDRVWQYWDARSRGEYTGQRFTAQRNGHIPGAIHCEWTSLMDPQRGLRIRADSAQLLSDAGLDLERPCITYCQSNHRSGFSYLVGCHLGMDIQPYPGAWSEWGNRDDTAIEHE